MAAEEVEARAFYFELELDSDANDTSAAVAVAVVASVDARSTYSAVFWTLSKRRRSSEPLVDHRTSSFDSLKGAGAAEQRSAAAVDARMSWLCKFFGWPYSTGRCLDSARRYRCPRTSS